MCVAARGFAQTDLTGQWRPLLHEDIGHRLDEAAAAPGISGAGGPWIGDYTGLPINDAARYKAESWDARIYNAKEHQTILQPGAYWILSPGGIRISNIFDEATEQSSGSPCIAPAWLAARHAPSGWMAAQRRLATHRTPGKGSRAERGKATC